MSKVAQWSQGKPILLAIYAQQFAASAEHCYDALDLVKNDQGLSPEMSLPPLDDWLLLYRQHRRPLDFFRSLISGFDLGQTALQYADGIFALRGIPQDKIQKFWRRLPHATKVKIVVEIQKEAEKALALSIKDVNEDLTDEIDAPTQARLISLMQSPAAFFFFRIWSPCLLLYSYPVTRLLRRAYQSDLDALEKLLRLDSSLVHDRRIGRILHHLRATGKRRIYENLMSALLKPPKSKITRQKVKVSVAGIISAISVMLKHPLTETDIRELFDAIADDSGKGPGDADLPPGQWAFSKAIQRDRAIWLPILMPDKK